MATPMAAYARIRKKIGFSDFSFVIAAYIKQSLDKNDISDLSTEWYNAINRQKTSPTVYDQLQLPALVKSSFSMLN